MTERKNHPYNIRLSKEVDDIISEAAPKLGMTKNDLVRFLLRRGCMKLKSEAQVVNGYENLDLIGDKEKELQKL